MSNVSEKRRKLKQAFTSAKTIQENLEAFKKMDESKLFQESELGLYCLPPLIYQLQFEGNDPQKVLSFGKRSLKSLENMSNRGNSNEILPCTESSTRFHHINFVIAQVLNLLGSACFDLNMFIDSLRYFELAYEKLSVLEKEKSSYCTGNCFLIRLEFSQAGLFEVKKVMGRIEDAVPHRRKVLEIREKTMEEGCIDLGETYKDVYKAYLVAMDMKEALPFCLKALEIYKKHLGSDSMEVAKMMSDLGVIHYELGEWEKALEHNLLARSVMKKVDPSSPDLLKAELVNGFILTKMGRNEEAIKVLSALASNAEADGRHKADAFCNMAGASFNLGKLDDAKKYMKIAQRSYEKEEMDPLFVAAGFKHMSSLCESMNDRETAILFARRVIAIPKIPQKLLLEATTRLFMLVSRVGKEEEAIPYMEDAVEKLKDSVGPNHYKVGYGCKILGAAYMKTFQPELAVKCLKNAKDIMDVCRGPNHLESLETSHNLARTYGVMNRVEPAIEIEEKVVEGLKGLGPLDQGLQKFMDEAVKLLKILNKMKETMAGPAGPLINDLLNLMMEI